MWSKAKEKAIDRIWKQALKVRGKYTFDSYKKIWDIASDYNSNHEDEIFLCEMDSDSEGNKVFGIYIEDDYLIFERY